MVQLFGLSPSDGIRKTQASMSVVVATAYMDEAQQSDWIVAMLDATDTEQSPWNIVRSDDKKRARLNCISHLISQIPYEKVHGKK
jgi:hypothetical protein